MEQMFQTQITKVYLVHLALNGIQTHLCAITALVQKWIIVLIQLTIQICNAPDADYLTSADAEFQDMLSFYF